MAGLDSHAIQNLLPLFERVNHLKSLPRTGWLFAGVSSPESLADHTSGVALMSLFLAESINQAPAEHGLTAPLDVGRVTRLALIHDLAESVLTDLPKTSARVLGEAVKHEAESRIMTSLLGELSWGQGYISLWQEYSEAASAEARLVKDVDKLEMVVQALRYARRGHQNLDEFWQGHSWHYAACQQIFDSLFVAFSGSQKVHEHE